MLHHISLKNTCDFTESTGKIHLNIMLAWEVQILQKTRFFLYWFKTLYSATFILLDFNHNLF